MTSIHPSAVVAAGVELGERVTVGPHAVLLGPLEVGDDCWIGAGAVLGPPPEITGVEQNAAWRDGLRHRGVLIGPRTVVRELSTVHQGNLAATVIGADCWLLNRSYVAHDGALGDRVTLSAGVSVGGYATIGSDAVLGMNAAVHQRRVIGQGAIVGMACPVTRDVPPFVKAYGSPMRWHGLNERALRERGLDPDDLPTLASLDAAYRAQRVPELVPPELAEDFAWWSAARERAAGVG